MFRGGGGPRIDSPEELIGIAVLLVIAALVWLWKIAD
jgi:hypothetical protein